VNILGGNLSKNWGAKICPKIFTAEKEFVKSVPDVDDGTRRVLRVLRVLRLGLHLQQRLLCKVGPRSADSGVSVRSAELLP
jgi:hypothetical protein